MLVQGGALIDLQPIPPSPSLHAGGNRLGKVDQSQVWERFARGDPGVEAVVRAGLFELETELEFDVIERFESKETLIATINGRDDWHITDELAARLEMAGPPIDGLDRMRLRRYRAGPS
ncbi:MAG TPA: hypothetical protein VIA10_03760 [Gaiellaceae bacterium]|jgi:hypothetical protein